MALYLFVLGCLGLALHVQFLSSGPAGLHDIGLLRTMCLLLIICALLVCVLGERSRAAILLNWHLIMHSTNGSRACWCYLMVMLEVLRIACAWAILSLERRVHLHTRACVMPCSACTTHMSW